MQTLIRVCYHFYIKLIWLNFVHYLYIILTQNVSTPLNPVGSNYFYHWAKTHTKITMAHPSSTPPPQ